MPESTPSEVARKRHARSRVTNGGTLLPGVDGRSAWVRRARDVLEAHIADLGGDCAISEAERSIVRRAATLTTELERIEALFATGEADDEALGRYVTGANALRRLLETVGLRRRPRNVTPDLADYLAAQDADI